MESHIVKIFENLAIFFAYKYWFLTLTMGGSFLQGGLILETPEKYKRKKTLNLSSPPFFSEQSPPPPHINSFSPQSHSCPLPFFIQTAAFPLPPLVLISPAAGQDLAPHFTSFSFSETSRRHLPLDFVFFFLQPAAPPFSPFPYLLLTALSLTNPTTTPSLPPIGLTTATIQLLLTLFI